MDSASEDPYRLLRLAASGILLAATVFALVLALSGAEPRALVLAGACWALYGLIVGLIDGVLEPVTDLAAMAFQNVGLLRGGQGYSGIEAMVARGHYLAAADAYLERATQEHDVIAMVRRSALLAGPLGTPELAVTELEDLRTSQRLNPGDDIRVGLMLAELLEHRLKEPGRAMGELRRLLDRYPESRWVRQIRATLRMLKAERFGTGSSGDTPGSPLTPSPAPELGGSAPETPRR